MIVPAALALATTSCSLSRWSGLLVPRLKLMTLALQSIAQRRAASAAVDAWYQDPEYQKVLPLRDQAYAELEINVYQE